MQGVPLSVNVRVTGLCRLVVDYRVRDGVESTPERRRTVFSRDPASPWWTRREEAFRDGQWRIIGVERVGAPTLTLDGGGDETRRGPHTFAGP